jgi:hypothetical protein
MKNKNMIIGIGFLVLAYVLYKQSKKKAPAQPQTQPQQQDDTMVSQYNIVPLPDLKNYRFQTIVPTTLMGNTTTTTPLIIAMPTR